MPSKVTVFIAYLTELYGLQPYWSKDFDLNAVLGCKSAGPQISNPEKTRKSKAGSVAQSAKKSGPTNDLTC
jgi:hypothetical protein